MMKILSAKQMADVDRATCEEQQITSVDLMERAAHTVFLALKQRYSDLTQQHFTILCGKGNNGGDGLVLARLLDACLADVQVYLWQADRYSADNLLNQQRISHIPIQHFSETDHLDFPSHSIILDCLFGYGLQEELDDRWLSIIQQINQSKRPVYAIDMPSGLLADRPTSEHGLVVHADLVYTFQVPKLGLLMPQNQIFYDEFQVLDIQLSSIAMESADTHLTYVDQELLLSFYRKRKKFDHKGIFGHVLIVGGSKGKIGAVQLALKAALRSGCGLATAYLPACGITIIQTAVPEAMVLSDNHHASITDIPNVTPYQAVGIGIGLGEAVGTVEALSEFLRRRGNQPMVLDADALNILSKAPELWAYVPKDSILTPHPKELRRIIGIWQDDWDKLEKVKRFAKNHQLHILIKGANSMMLLADGQIFINSTGNVGMATGGSGDVLTGIITALMGQGYFSHQALILGVYIHGRAADMAVQTIGAYSLLPSDTIRFLPQAFLELERSHA
ncbi:NAD(P)H-hydrate dehydratase [Sphingobacterium sp. SRCM116780]|uniref:NAD(P)H-hydrate dehydratase n=1 Tax=Sphingobacterium sp. SRCM116780 TaxID=2907623 RepID=UPI001F38EF85|nr:NAD(P)H-hydrate dehydratase [Sphingobacterium sp. SRCM116780]UIR57369.1 NAD(P)H-hydrate dehydratase [Sphingobacterium sp. SRCM116780]